VLLKKLICNANCKTFRYRILLSLIDLILIQPFLVTIWPFITLIILSVFSINADLKLLKSSSKSLATVSTVQLERIALSYRTLQIVGKLHNQLYQRFFWPNLQLFGALVIIASCYCLILLHNDISPVALSFILIFVVLATGFIVIALDTGSKPILLSRSVLHSWKQVGEICSRGKWFAKFSKSCRPICYYSGTFHAVDRTRAPIFIRFCLQRTFFLVFKTRLSN